MKKLLAVACAGMFLLCWSASAMAVDLSTYGFMKVVGQYTDNYGFIQKDNGASDFAVNQRARTWFDFAVSENLKATVGLEWDSAWGNSDGLAGRNDGLALMGDQNMIETKHLYFDFTLPNTDVSARLGQFWVELPSNFGSSILGGDMPAVQINTPVSDQLSMTLGWARPYDLNGGFGETKADNSGDDQDLLFVTMPYKGDGFSITPFGVYGMLGDGGNFGTVGYGGATSLGYLGTNATNFGDSLDAWWLGFSGDLTMMDPIAILYDFNYGKIEGDDAKSSGFVADLALQYKMDMMTFEIMGFYGSGDDAKDVVNDQEGGRMPVYFTESFGPTGLGYSNCFALTGPIADGVFSYHQAGMMSLGLALKDITFNDKLTGAVQLRYNEGTNDKDMAAIYGTPANNQLTEEDSAIEFGFQANYALYENLKATLDAGYISLDMDEDTWGQKFEEDITRVAAGLTYNW